MRKYIIGIDLGGTNIKSSIFTLEFQKIHERSDPTVAVKGPFHVLNRIVHIIQEMLLSNVINLFNPEVIIVGGGMSAAGDRLLNTVRDTVEKHALRLSSRACKIVQAKLGGQAGMIGAAAYAKNKMSL